MGKRFSGWAGEKNRRRDHFFEILSPWSAWSALKPHASQKIVRIWARNVEANNRADGGREVRPEG
jgi:hypothetical protein